jgi:hypothetical protein
MVVGNLPFNGKSSQEVINSILYEYYKIPSDIEA